MKITRIVSTIVLGGLLIGAVGCKKSGRSATESASLDGTWVGSDMDNPGAQCQVTIGNKNFQFRGTNENDSFSGTISVLYEETQPGSLDVNITDPASMAGKAALFRFEHKSKDLKLAWMAPGTLQRPIELVPAPGVRVLSLKRQ